jgi:hypothetical protein
MPIKFTSEIVWAFKAIFGGRLAEINPLVELEFLLSEKRSKIGTSLK